MRIESNTANALQRALRESLRPIWAWLLGCGLILGGGVSDVVAQPANDNFANAQVLPPNSVGSVAGSTVGATSEPNEPSHWQPNASGASIWFRWIAPSNSIYTFNTVGSDYDTVLAIYTGSSLDSLILVVNNDDSGGTLQSRVTFDAMAGTEYLIAVDGYDYGNGSQTGTVLLNWFPGGFTPPVIGIAGEINFSSGLYVATENETVQAPYTPRPTINGRSVKGALITVTRTMGTAGRVLVDYSTVEDPNVMCGDTNSTVAVPDCDYTATSGTLVFDDFQMSRSFVVPVFSDLTDNSGDKVVPLILSNPQAADQEEAANPGLIAPVLGARANALLRIAEINYLVGTNVGATNFVIERATYAVDERAGSITVDILNPSGVAGEVGITVTGSNDKGRYVPIAGSDYVNPTDSTFPNTPYTDGTANIQDPSDFTASSTNLMFAAGQRRLSYTIPIANDGTVEFNEDIYVFLRIIPGNQGGHRLGRNSSARVTILYDEQPAGALDREWNPDNVSYTTPRFNTSPGANNTVRAVAVQPDDRTVIGGDFTAYNSAPRGRIARINVDGSLDTAFNPGSGADDFVNAVAVYPASGNLNDSRIVMGGGFSSVNNIQRNGVARLNVNGSLDTSFNPGSGANAVVRSVAIQSDGKVLIAGDFTEFNGVGRHGIARLNTNGTLDATFDPGAGADGTIWAVAVEESQPLDRKIFIGGEFLNFNNEYRGGVARLSDNGSLDVSFNPGGGADGPIYTVAPQSDGSLLIGGAFGFVDFTSRNNLARLDASGALDLTHNPGSGANDSVYSIILQPDNKALVGGVFTSFNGTRRMGLTRLFVDGTVDTSFLDTAFNHFAGLINAFHFESPNYVNSVGIQTNGDVLIGGSFMAVGGNFAFQLENHNAPAVIGNSYTVWTRADKRVRYNVARLIGGYTLGPGNIEFVYDQNTIDEHAGSLVVPLRRRDGRVGTVQGVASTHDNLAMAGSDYSAVSGAVLWNESAFVGVPRHVGFTGERFFSVPITEDMAIEGDELFGLSLTNPVGSINLGGEIVPLGGALGRARADALVVDNDFNYGVFAFSSATYATNENAVTNIITVVRTNGSSGFVSVRYFTRDGTATNNLDYLARSGTLNFDQGVTTQFIRVPIIDDNIVEADETFTIVLTNASGGATLAGGLSSVSATSTIIDNDFLQGRANFASATYATNEAAGMAQITLVRLGGSFGQLSVSVAATNGTAISGSDFTAVTNTITWFNGDVGPKTFFVPLLDDAIVEVDETVRLRIFNPSVSGAVGSVSNATLTIREDDAYGALSFSQPIFDADERGANVNITVIRTGGAGGTVSVGYRVLNGTASNTVDFIATDGTLTFGPGVTAASFPIAILNNGFMDGLRTTVLLLTNFNLALPGPITNATLRIFDDESIGDPAGSLDTTFNAFAGGTNAIQSLALQPDGRILVAGEFRTMNHILRNRVARLLQDGSLDASFNPRQGPNAPVRTMVLQPDGRVVIGGFFDQVHGTNRNHIARLLADGTLDRFFDPGAGADNPVYALALLPEGRVVMGGSFATVNGISRSGIALLETNGVVSPTFTPGSGVNGTVLAVAVQNDGKILIGGDFTLVNGVSRPRLARLNPNGSVDLSFNAGIGPNDAVQAITLQPDGRILVGGSFTSINGITRIRLARLDSSGVVDSSFLDSLQGGNGDVSAITLQFDGNMIVVGDFTRFNGVTRNRITRLTSSGGTDPTINFGEGANDGINAAVIQEDRKILIAGRFTTFDGEPRQFLARLHGGSIAGPGSLEFRSPFYTVLETGVEATIVVRRRGGTTGDATVDYLTEPGTATPGSDYVSVSGRLTFLEGETHQSFTVPILNDFVGEPDETVSLLLTNQSSGVTLGAVPTATLTIVNDDSGVGLSASAYSVNENTVSGGVLITVIRTGATNGTARVNYTTTNGVAKAGQDYVATSGLLTFQPGETVQTFIIPIIDDTLIEGNETFGVILSNLVGSAALSIAAATVTIVDNDFRPGQLSVAAAAYTVAESAGSLTITVLRTNGSTGVVSVDYATIDGGALAGSDFVNQMGTLVFAEGETNRTLVLNILDDSLVEGDESFTLRLFNPGGGAIITGPTNITITILDEEFGPGSLDRSFDPGAGANSLVRSVALGPGGKVVLGGAFTAFDDFSRNYIARLNADGSLDLSFDPGTGANALVNTVLAAPDGKAVLGGGFNEVGGVTFNRVARLHTNGAPDLNFNPGGGSGFNASVLAMALQSNGRFTVGGSFTLPTRGVVQLRANGSVDTSFNPGTGANGPVHAVIVQPDNRVLIGGSFSSVGGVPRARVARLNVDGTLDDTFAPTVVTNGVVFSLAVQSDGKVLAGGDFVTTGGTNHVGLVRLNADGSLDTGFNPGSINGIVFGVVLQAQGDIVIGGNFTRINGVTRNRYARLLPSGALDTSFDPGLGANNTVYALVVQPDGNIVIGGDFTQVTGVPRSGVARILGGGLSSEIRFTSIRLAPVRLTISSVPGKSYVLEASADLISWQDIAANTAVSGTLEFTDPNAGIFNRRFYRVREAP